MEHHIGLQDTKIDSASIGSISTNDRDNDRDHDGHRLSGSVMLLQHAPVYTLGTGTKEGSGPFKESSEELPFDTFNVERAGEGTSSLV